MGKEKWAGHCSLACQVNTGNQDALPFISLMREPVQGLFPGHPQWAGARLGPEGWGTDSLLSWSRRPHHHNCV